ncbi:alpha/beta fold hydrolase [Roseomonas sp. M0104]|uniref:Alpha/beta fold hydrolase n=1 Tax=Teichococcus coralli TaxID=2545983 RepID=A0A845BB37_9PROT|nr:alpha/beta fold hydrolase [Pseudoroseomonas coralli]MXP62582.1 alpha/beta fold hydrolase [Pseudoroseomonas coralli]
MKASRLALALGSLTALLAALLAGCAPRMIGPGPAIMPSSMAAATFTMPDGAALPLRAWPAQGAVQGVAQGTAPEPARAIILGLHGFGDTASNAFGRASQAFTASGIAFYAYDQRGFGGAPHRGVWPGVEGLVQDATRVARLIRERHPGLPLYLMGESMGGAVALAAAASADPPPVDGIILVAPAVEGRASMSWLTRGLLDFAAHTVPLLEIRNSAPGFAPTDDEEAMRGWGRDPLTYKEVRVDAVFGLVGLMDVAVAAAPHVTQHLLVLYGGEDRIIDPKPVQRLLRALPDPARQRGAYYPQGYHMLLRDKNRVTVAADVLAWMQDPAAPLPSGSDQAARAWLAQAR